jgi:hypothetical protein
MGMFDGFDWASLMNANEGGAMPPLGGPAAGGPNFDDIWSQRIAPPAAPQSPAGMPQSPISPENVAANFAARGVPPPKVDIPPQNTDVGAALTGDAPMRMAPAEATQNWRRDTDRLNGGTPGTATQAPGQPMSITTPAQDASVAAGAGTAPATPAKKGDSLMDALRGVKAPANPEVQRISTPAAPKLTSNVKSGQLIALLNSLGGGQPAPRALPSTLSQAIGRG